MDNLEYLKNIKNKFSLSEIKNILETFSNKKVIVIGDTIIDEYCFVEPKGRAMKDPTLSVEYRYEEAYAGGILAIANHLSTFVNQLTLVTILGDNYDQKEFVLSKLAKNIKAEFFIKNNSPTTRKKRFLSNNRNEKLFKIEYMNDSPISLELEEQLSKFLEKELLNYDIVIVGDFGHGFINQKLINILEKKSKYLAVNSQTNSANIGFNYITRYNTPSYIAMDGKELEFSVGEPSTDYNYLIKKLYTHKKFNNFLVAIGKGGVNYFYNNKIYNAPSLVSKVTDVVGAGDAVFSITSLLAYNKVDPDLLTFIANCAGGVKVNIIGNKESVTKEKLISFVEEIYKSIDEKDINNYFNSVNETLNRLDKSHVNSFVSLLLDAYHNRRNIYVFGNGGSSATASHFCGDLIKGVSYGLDKRFKAICLSDNVSSMMAIANDVSYDDIFVEQLKNFLQKDDLVVGISGSGNSKNVVKALEYAKENGAKTVAICGYKGGKIKEISDLAIHAEVNDMEISEDIHNLVLIHTVKRMLTNELNQKNVGGEYEKRVS